MVCSLLPFFSFSFSVFLALLYLSFSPIPLSCLFFLSGLCGLSGFLFWALLIRVILLVLCVGLSDKEIEDAVGGLVREAAAAS